MGESGRNAIKKNLPRIISKNKIDFVIVNGENAANDGRGITKEIAEEFFLLGVDVITSGNHIWDKQETTNYIDKENRLLRPANLVEGSPGKGYEIYLSKDKNATKHFPAEGEGTLSGVIVETDLETGLAKKVTRLIVGGNLGK